MASSAQASQVLLATDLGHAEARQMVSAPLHIQQARASAPLQAAHERHHRNLGCVALSMKHRLTGEQTADFQSIESASQFASLPHLH